MDLLAGIWTVHVPCMQGAALMMTDLISGNYGMLTAIPQALPHVKSGRLRAPRQGIPREHAQHRTCRRSPKRFRASTTRHGMACSRRRTPRAIIERVNSDLTKALRAA